MSHLKIQQWHSDINYIQAAIELIQTRKTCDDDDNKCKHIGKEFNVYEATGKRTHNWEPLFNGLISVALTSDETEIPFRFAGLFITKLRTRLSDRSIDRLCFLKIYFINKWQICVYMYYFTSRRKGYVVLCLCLQEILNFIVLVLKLNKKNYLFYLHCYKY